MKLFARLVLSFASNFIALLAIANLIAGIEINLVWENFVGLVVVFTLINSFIRPLVRWILTPFVILTLGLFTIVINAAMIWLLDFFSQNISVSGLMPLIGASLVVGFINILINFSAKYVGSRAN